jgi:signal transduction histidine kinase
MSSWRRHLLPGEPGGPRSARDWLTDVVMVVVSAVVSGLVVLGSSRERAAWYVWLDVAAGVLAFGSLWWRRRHPDRVGILTGALSIGSGLATGPGLIGAFNSAVRGSRRGVYAVLALSVVAIVVNPVLWPSKDSNFGTDVVVGVLVMAVAFSWGFLVRVRRDQIAGVRERAVSQAREAERRRIAREMHDVLAHRLSLLSLHAGALEYRRDASAAEVAEAAGVIRRTAREALEDLREVVGVLRDGDPVGVPEAPQPTLAALEALIETARAAGLRIDARLERTDGVPALAARTAYRIVQEGLTNASKHAAGAVVEVVVGGRDPLEVSVTTRTPVGVASTRDPLPGAGSGLVGLTERVALAGGTLDHGPTPAGDFVLRARLPWSAS